MKTLAKTLVFFALMLFISGTINAQAEAILKNAIPEYWGALAITNGKKYDKKEKQTYRDLYIKFDKASQDIRQYEIGILTEETVQIFDYKELKRLGKDQKKIDSLKFLIKTSMTTINDYMKWDERLAADSANAPIVFMSFKDNFAAKKFEEAYLSWSTLFKKYPVISSSIYTGGASLLSYKIENSTDEETKQKYIDTLFLMYDQQMKVYPQLEAYVLSRKTIDFHNFYVKDKDLNDSITREYIHENYLIASDCIDRSKEKTKYYVFPVAMKLSLYEYQLKKITDEQFLDNYINYSDLLTKILEAETKEEEKTKIQKGGVEAVDMIFTASELSTCEHLIPIFQKRYDEKPDDVNNLKKIISTLGKKSCTDDPLYVNAAVSLFNIEPSAKYAYTIGMIYARQEKLTDAAQYFEKAIELETVDSLKAIDYLQCAKVYNKLGQFSKAREYCYKSIELKPVNGEAYIVIATMYAASAGSGSFEQQAIYWAAVDKLIQAKNNDPAVTESANSLINSYSAGYPTKEEGFMQGYPEGTPYNIGGWIGETTTARYIR